MSAFLFQKVLENFYIFLNAGCLKSMKRKVCVQNFSFVGKNHGYIF